MDTYTSNSSEYIIDLNQYQHYFPIQHIGLGLCPLGCHTSIPSENCIRGRIQHGIQYGVNEIDLWSLWDSSVNNWSVVEKAWAPWIAPLQEFLSGSNTIIDNTEDELCWNTTTTENIKT